MQDGHPDTYGSMSLTPTEVQYVQIEKELLAIVFGMESLKPTCMEGTCWLNLIRIRRGQTVNKCCF